MKCIVTAGPSYEPLDQVRRLTNFSTGRLGGELADFLTARGHEVTLLLGEQATWKGQSPAQHVQLFGSTGDLSVRLEALSRTSVDAVFHVAAVSDFTVGTVWEHAADGEMIEVKAGKISSRIARLLVELVPTIKIISHLRDWFPQAVLMGWKYEVDGDRSTALRQGEQQIAQCRTDACVVNGPAYGRGFGVVTAPGRRAHVPEQPLLYRVLEELLRKLAND